MKTGKDIDSIYRDRLKGAKMPPPQDSWENILSRLPEKEEKRKLFPLWIKLAGVAAVVAIIFTVATVPSSNSTMGEEFTVRPGGVQMNFDTSGVSTTFNEIMQESGILLQALILKSQEMKLQQNNNNIVAVAQQEVHISEVPSEESDKVQNAYLSKRSNSEVSSEAEELSEKMAASNELAEASTILKEKEADLTPEKSKSEGKFRLSTRIAPIYFNNFGSGNAVENSFSQKAGAGEVTVSYGVNIAYEVSEKVNIRSGINKVDLAYNTRQISFNEVATTKTFAKNMSETTMLASPANGTLNQKMGFFEVPLEVEYVLVDRKFAVGLIGGGSALFLEEDQVSLETMGLKTDLGETNSMNKLSFTTNFGVSLGYDVSRQLQLSLEPVVKLQMNTFKNGTDSNPYFFGIYSGLSYRF